MKNRLLGIIRTLGALSLLVGTLYLVRPGVVIEQLSHLHLGWFMCGALLCLATYGLIAWRWYTIVAKLGVPLSYYTALSDYILGGLFNQALPTGLAGPAYRALRHSRRVGADGAPVPMEKAVSGVVIDRMSGLAGQAILALLGGLALVRAYPLIGLWAAIAVSLTIGVALIVLRVARRRYEAFGDDLHIAFLEKHALRWQLTISSFSVVLLCLAFYCATRAMHQDLAWFRVLSIAPLVLGAMVIPLSIAGWGVREAAAGALFLALGTDAGIGVSVSVTFGLMSLVSTLPGLILWMRPDARQQAAEHSSED